MQFLSLRLAGFVASDSPLNLIHSYLSSFPSF